MRGREGDEERIERELGEKERKRGWKAGRGRNRSEEGGREAREEEG